MSRGPLLYSEAYELLQAGYKKGFIAGYVEGWETNGYKLLNDLVEEGLVSEANATAFKAEHRNEVINFTEQCLHELQCPEWSRLPDTAKSALMQVGLSM